jgi:hypothetical protein
MNPEMANKSQHPTPWAAESAPNHDVFSAQAAGVLNRSAFPRAI